MDLKSFRGIVLLLMFQVLFSCGHYPEKHYQGIDGKRSYKKIFSGKIYDDGISPIELNSENQVSHSTTYNYSKILKLEVDSDGKVWSTAGYDEINSRNESYFEELNLPKKSSIYIEHSCSPKILTQIDEIKFFPIADSNETQDNFPSQFAPFKKIARNGIFLLNINNYGESKSKLIDLSFKFHNFLPFNNQDQTAADILAKSYQDDELTQQKTNDLVYYSCAKQDFTRSMSTWGTGLYALVPSEEGFWQYSGYSTILSMDSIRFWFKAEMSEKNLTTEELGLLGDNYKTTIYQDYNDTAPIEISMDGVKASISFLKRASTSQCGFSMSNHIDAVKIIKKQKINSDQLGQVFELQLNVQSWSITEPTSGKRDNNDFICQGLKAYLQNELATDNQLVLDIGYVDGGKSYYLRKKPTDPNGIKLTNRIKSMDIPK